MTIMSGQELVRAAKGGSLDRVSYHLKKGAHPDARDEEGYTALYWAACRGHSAICRILMLYDADVNSISIKSGATPLMACADNNQVGCMEGFLRQRSIRIDQHNARGDTALHMGAYRGYKSVVQLLIQHNANPFLLNNLNRSALKEAQLQEDNDCIKILHHHMEAYKLHTQGNTLGQKIYLPCGMRAILSNDSKECQLSQRKPTESQWTKGEEIYSPVHTSQNYSTDHGGPSQNPSFQSTDSAVIISTPNDISHPQYPPKTSSLDSANETPKDLQLPNDCSLGYGEVTAHDFGFIGDTSFSKISCTQNSLSISSKSHHTSPASADSQYHSYNTSTPSPVNISLDDGRLFTSAEKKATYSKSKITYPASTDSQYQSFASTTSSGKISLENRMLSTSSKSVGDISIDTLVQMKSPGKTKPVRYTSEKCDKYSSQVNDLSCQRVKGDCNFNLLPSSVQSLNILPEGKAQNNLNVKSKANHSSKASCYENGNQEIVKGERLSQFIENLQMKLFICETALCKERQMNFNLQQEVKTLKEENGKLKDHVQRFHEDYNCRKS